MGSNSLASSRSYAIFLGFFLGRRSLIFFNTRFDVLVECKVMVDGVEWDEDVFNFFWTGVPGSCFALFDFPMGDLRPCSVLVDFLFFAPADEDVFFFLQTGVGGFRAVFIDFLMGVPGPSSISFALLLLA